MSLSRFHKTVKERSCIFHNLRWSYKDGFKDCFIFAVSVLSFFIFSLIARIFSFILDDVSLKLEVPFFSSFILFFVTDRFSRMSDHDMGALVSDEKRLNATDEEGKTTLMSPRMSLPFTI